MLNIPQQMEACLTCQLTLTLCSSAPNQTTSGLSLEGVTVILEYTRRSCPNSEDPLSNYYPVLVTHKDIHHDTIEHAYQYVKTSRGGDKAAGKTILYLSTSVETKQAGRIVTNFDRKDWDQVKTGIMLDLLRIKFKVGSRMADFLKATTAKSLAEAGQK